MRDSRIPYVTVGLFVLGAVVLLVAALAWVSGRTGATDTYHVVYANVTGVVPGTEVLFEGFPVGQVAAIHPFRAEERQRYRVEVRVRKGWPIPEDSGARITAPGLLAAFAIEIEAGESATLLAPGSEIRGFESADVFAAVSSLAGQIEEFTRTGLEPLVQSLSARAPRILENLESFSTELAASGERLGKLTREENTAHVDVMLRNFRATSENVAQVTSELRTTQTAVQGLLQGLNQLIDSNHGHVSQSAADLRYSLESVARHIDAINYNLEGASRNMNEFSRQLRENPGVILRGTEPGDGVEGTQ